MAIPCAKCTRPVHERTVVCPHCGERTGVPSDPIAEAEISLLAQRDAKPEPLPLPLMVRAPQRPDRPDPSAGLPRAVARKRPR